MAVSDGRRALAVAVALAVVYVVWGSTYLGIAVAIETMPPLLMAAARFLAAGAILYVAARRLEAASGTRRPGGGQWLAALVTGTLLLGVGTGGVAWAEQTVASGVAALVIASTPLWIVVLDRVVFGARLTRAAAVGLALGFGGVALLVAPSGSSRIDPAGALVLLVAAVGWAGGSLLSRGTRLTVSPLVGAGMQMLCGGAALAVAGVAAGELGELRLEELSARSLVAWAYLVVFGSLVAFTAYAWLLRNAATSLVATYAYVNPVVAVLLGWAVLSEAMTARTAVAGAIVVAAVAIIVSASGAGQPRRAPRRDRSERAGAKRPAPASSP